MQWIPQITSGATPAELLVASMADCLIFIVALTYGFAANFLLIEKKERKYSVSFWVHHMLTMTKVLIYTFKFSPSFLLSIAGIDGSLMPYSLAALILQARLRKQEMQQLMEKSSTPMTMREYFFSDMC